MIKGEVKFNSGKFDKALSFYAAGTKKSPGEVLRYWAPTVLRSVVLLTPPFDDKNAQREVTRIKTNPQGNKLKVVNVRPETWTTQRRAGERAIDHDLRSLFKPNDWDKRINTPRIKKRIRKLIQTRNWQGLSKVLEKMGFGYFPPDHFISAPSREIHKRNRNNRGRVRRRAIPYFVSNAPSIGAYIKSRQQNIGTAKGGWVTGAQAKGFPPWITNKARGSYDDHSNAAKPYIRLGNTIGFLAAIDADTRIVNRALDQVAGKMTRSLRGFLAELAKKSDLVFK